MHPKGANSMYSAVERPWLIGMASSTSGERQTAQYCISTPRIHFEASKDSTFCLLYTTCCGGCPRDIPALVPSPPTPLVLLIMCKKYCKRSKTNILTQKA